MSEEQTCAGPAGTNDLQTFVSWLQSSSESPPAMDDPTLCAIARAIASQHGHARIEAFWAELDQLNGKGDKIRAGIEAMMQGLDCPAPATSPAQDADPVSAPALPAYAGLTDAQQTLANEACPWLDSYVAFASRASPMTPKEFHTAAGLFVGSLAIARRLHLPVSVDTNSIYPNLYLLFVGPSTVQRKTTALHVVRGLLKAGGMEHFLLADRQTPEALALDLSIRIPDTHDAWPPRLQKRWLEERAIAGQRGWLLEEASHLLDSFNRDFSAGLLPMVLDLYDCPNETLTQNTVGRGRQLVEKPYLSIFGVTTYGAMAEHLTKRQLWNNGFFARIAIVGSDDVGTWQFWPQPQCYPNELVQRLRFVASELLPLPQARMVQDYKQENGKPEMQRIVEIEPPLGSCPVVLERGSEAWQAWERYSKAVSHDMLLVDSLVERDLRASYGRFGTMLIKVAIILAAFDSEQLPVVIRPCHVYRAQQTVEEWRHSLHRVLPKLNEVNRKNWHDEIKTALAKAGEGWVTRRNLQRDLNCTWSVISERIDDLEAWGEIERRLRKNKRGRDTEEYRLIASQEEKLS